MSVYLFKTLRWYTTVSQKANIDSWPVIFVDTEPLLEFLQYEVVLSGLMTEPVELLYVVIGVIH